jgi:hypothetical protein
LPQASVGSWSMSGTVQGGGALFAGTGATGLDGTAGAAVATAVAGFGAAVPTGTGPPPGAWPDKQIAATTTAP